jgi:plastocyanin
MGNKAWRLMAVLLCVLVLGGNPQHSVARTNATTVIQFGVNGSFTYDPNFVVVHPGDTVEWQGTFSSHPLVSDDGLWTTVNSGASFTHTFTSTGTFLFHCFFHGGAGGLGMAGRIAVVIERAFVPLILRDA